MLLLERGANIEEVNDEGYTPLMEASREGHEEMVALLLSQGADINAQTEETQETALTLACCGGTKIKIRYQHIRENLYITILIIQPLNYIWYIRRFSRSSRFLDKSWCQYRIGCINAVDGIGARRSY